MVKFLFAGFAAILLGSPCALAADPPTPPPAQAPAQDAPPPPASVSQDSVKIRPKKASPAEEEGLLAPDVGLIDAPTSAVLDFGGYSAHSRFFSGGGLLQYVSFGVFQRLNIGASLDIDGIVGSEKTVHLRDPNLQIKYRFYDGDRWIPSFAAGYDGQGFRYNQPDKKYNNRQRGFFFVASEELGLPGLQIHPSFNISDTNTNSFFGAVPVSYNIRDKVLVMAEWDNINKMVESRFNAGLRVYVTGAFHVDLALRAIGQGGTYSDDAPRGPERIVALGYTGSF